MSVRDFFQVFALVHGMLAASLLFFWVAKRLANLAGVRIAAHAWLTTAQILVASSLLLPVGVSFLPRAAIPETGRSVFFPAEEIESLPAEASAHRSVLKEQTSEEPINSVADSLFTRLGNWADSSEGDWVLLLGLGCWGLGSLGFLIRFSRGFRKLRGILDSALLLKRCGRVRVVVSEAIAVPFSARTGFTAWVALPASMVERRKDFRIALRHELQHHRQGDTVWSMGIDFLFCFFYPNPAFSAWKRELNELQEFSCDFALLGRKGISSHEYGSCLLRVAETALRGREMHVGTMCMAATPRNPVYFKSFLRRRIEMFANGKDFRPHRWAGVVLGTLAVTVGFTLAYGAENALRKAEDRGVNPGRVVVDPEIQGIAENALKDALKSLQAKAGFAIVADPRTGKILAVANHDPKRSGYWSLSLATEPASFSKTLVTAQALDQGAISLDEKIPCENGAYEYRGQTFHDWKVGGWDELTPEEIVGVSSDIGSMKIAEKVGDAGLLKMLERFGFGPKGSARDFPKAKPGSLPKSRRGGQGLVPAVAAGYAFRSTPLELIQAYGAIANGGELLKAKLANASDSPETVRRVLSNESAEKTKEILRQVVLKGTAKGNAASTRYSTAGKTATSFIPDLTQWDLIAGKNKGNFAGFIGFAPVKDPQIEVYVGILDPSDKTGAHGSAHAAPVFTRIVDEVLEHWKVPSDQL